MGRLYNKQKKAKVPKTDSSIPMPMQETVTSHLTDEFSVAQRNMDKFHKDFEDYYNLLHCVRTNKGEEWESDIALPEFTARILTQLGNFVSQYFSSRDFVEPDIDSDDPRDVAEAKAGKTLLNYILNRKDLYYYPKIVRTITTAFMSGFAVIKGWYEQEIEPIIAGYEYKSEPERDEYGEYLAEDGTVFGDPYTQKPKMRQWEEPIYSHKVLRDTPNFDVYPIQNVYFDLKYAYSLQDKEYVIFETEMTLDELRADAPRCGYFNLEMLEGLEESSEEAGQDTYAKDDGVEDPAKRVSPVFMVYERWGKYPVLVKERDENGKPVKYEPGFDKYGDFHKDAENLECIVSYVKRKNGDGGARLIRFQVSPHKKRPMVRFLCYIDPIKDAGFGDGEMGKELQLAVNDNFNLMNYRTKLATTPAFKAKRFSGIDEKIKISPEKPIFVENLDDLIEFQIRDNIQGGLANHGMLTQNMDYVMATSPQTMGHSPERGETATQASIIAERANIRIGMKSMNLEFVGFTELYDMILALCDDFMLPETLEKILGKLAPAYNPEREDRYKPVSQALETEASKQFKIRMYDQLLGRIVQMQNPKTPMVVNYIMGQIIELMGSNFKHFKRFMFEEDPASVMLYQIAAGGGGQAPTPNPPPGAMAPQNQTGLPQSNPEQQIRQNQPM